MKVGVLFGFLLVGLGATSASALDTLGPIPNVPQSRCGGLSASRHVLRVDERLSFAAGPAHPEACYGSANWTWGGGSGLAMVGSCAPDSTACTFRATGQTGYEGNRWATLCIHGTSGFGSWTSCDYYAVIGKDEFELAGHAKDKDLAPLPGVNVFIPGKRGGTLVTDGTGFYSALLPLGTYSVGAFAPEAPATVFFPVPSADCSPAGLSCTVRLNQDRTADFRADTSQHVTLDFNPPSLPADGRSFGTIAVLDTNAVGAPIDSQPIELSPPLGSDPPFLICSPEGRLYPLSYPFTGDLLGANFTKPTDAAGRVLATVVAGTRPGAFTTSAGVPNSIELSEVSYRSLTLAGDPAGPVPESLPAEIRAAMAALEGTVGGYLSLAPLLSITDAGTAQTLLLDLLVRLMATGAVPQLGSAVDFAPIHSASGGAGILFYPHGTPRSQVLSLGLNARVLDVGTLLEGSGGAVILPDAYPTLAEWEFTGTFPHGQALAGRLNRVPGEELAYFGLPYPPPEGSVSSGGSLGRNTYDQQCVPPSGTLRALTVHSPVSVVLTDAAGNRVGTDARGRAVTDGVGIVQRAGDGATTIVVPAGGYSVRLVGTGTGPATLVSWTGGEAQVATFTAQPGASGSATLGAGGLEDVRFAGRAIVVTDGLRLRASAEARAIRGGRHRIRVRVRDQFGAPVAGALATTTGLTSSSALTNGRGVAVLVAKFPRRLRRATVQIAAPGFRPAQVRAGLAW